MTWRVLAVRLAGLALCLAVASVLIYGSLYVLPGGGPLGALIGGHAVTHAEILRLEAQYHLNASFFTQYLHWLGGVFHGNLGQSVIYHQSVSSLVFPRLVTTLQLVAYASVLIIVGGIGLGTAAALFPGRLGTGITALTAIGLAIPSFVAAVALIALFAVDLHWFPVFGVASGVLPRIRSLTLPAVALALSSLAYISQVTTGEVREQLRSEHVDTARVRGIPDRDVVRRHVLRNALLPVITVSGIQIAALFAYDAVIEVAFNINGIGAYLVQSIQQRDFAVVQAIALVMVTLFVVVNGVVDTLYAVLDPRQARSLER